MQTLKVDLGTCVWGILGSWVPRVSSRRGISLALWTSHREWYGSSWRTARVEHFKLQIRAGTLHAQVYVFPIF